MRKSGQALIEFVIILPIIIYLIIGIVDFAIIMSNKNQLESKMEDVITMYKNNSNKEEIDKFINKDIKDVTSTFEVDGKYTNIFLNKKQSVVTPGLSLILGNPFYIKVERVILNEE